MTQLMGKGRSRMADDGFGRPADLAAPSRWSGYRLDIREGRLLRAVPRFLPAAASELTIPPEVWAIGQDAFRGCFRLKRVHLPAGLKEIGRCAFKGTALEAIRLPDTVTDLGHWAFQNTRLRELELPPGVMPANCGYQILLGCPVRAVTLPPAMARGTRELLCDGLEWIEIKGEGDYFSHDGAVYMRAYGLVYLVCCPPGRSGLLTVPEGVDWIESFAFSGCTRLEELSLPANIQLDRRGPSPLLACTGLKRLIFRPCGDGKGPSLYEGRA